MSDQRLIRGGENGGLGLEGGLNVLAALGRKLAQRLLGDGEHPAGAAGTVVEQVGARRELVGDGQEDERRHQPHGVARRPVLARLLVVLLVEGAGVRWCSAGSLAGVLEAAKGFRRVKGCRDMPVLVAALRARDAQLGLDESSGMVA